MRAVAFNCYTQSDDTEGDAFVVGWVSEEGDEASKVVEAHAFHRIFGGSNRYRGREHEVKNTDLRDCPPEYRHIVKQVHDKQEVA